MNVNCQMKNILITGANGQLGNEMRVVSAEQQELVYHFTDVAELDICDIDAIERFVVEHAIDCIVNCAAYTNVNKAEEDTVLCDKLNHLAPANLARVAAKHRIGLIHVSTDYVFNVGTISLTVRMMLLAPTLCMALPSWQASRLDGRFIPRLLSSVRHGSTVPLVITL